MHVEFLLEEPSAEALLQIVAPRILGAQISFALHPFQGREDLMSKLLMRLRAYSNWLPHVYGDEWCVVVLQDEDRRDCHVLKQEMEQIAAEAKLVTRTAIRKGGGRRFNVLNRIAIEEIEAWYFGDVEGLRNAYPEIPATLAAREGFRNPDAIPGGTAEALARLLIARYPTGLPKREVARMVGPHLEPDRNSSASFCCFRDGLRELVEIGD